MPVEAGHDASDLEFDDVRTAEPFAKLHGKLLRRRSSVRAHGDVDGEGESEGERESGTAGGAPGAALEPEETAARARQAMLAAFTHPAARVEQQTVWLPYDRLGVGEDAVRRYGEAGVRASTQGATLNERSKVQVEEGPPDPDQQVV